MSAAALANSTGGGLFSFTATGEAVLALPVEGLDGQRLAEFIALCGPVVPRLIITERRALALGLDASTPMALSLSADDDANTILALVTDATNDRVPAGRTGEPGRGRSYSTRQDIARPAGGAGGKRGWPRHRVRGEHRQG